MREMGRNVADATAIGTGYLGVASHYANATAPIMTWIMLALSIVWLLWRMADRVIHGPKKGGEE